MCQAEEGKQGGEQGQKKGGGVQAHLFGVMSPPFPAREKKADYWG